jgi:hypothetical protein
MLAQPLKVAAGRLTARFEFDAQPVQRVEQSGHHVRRVTQRSDQLGAFFLGEGSRCR